MKTITQKSKKVAKRIALIFIILQNQLYYVRSLKHFSFYKFINVPQRSVGFHSVFNVKTIKKIQY